MDKKLVILDVDFTLFNWLPYWYHAHSSMLRLVSVITGIQKEVLWDEARDVFRKHGTAEYPFLVQSLPSVIKHYAEVPFEDFLAQCLNPAVECYKENARDHFRCFEGVVETIKEIHARRLPIAILTDAPRYVALWRLKKMGILNYLDSVWGLEDPFMPICQKTGKVLVHPDTLQKHHRRDFCGFQGHTETLSESYEKPDPRGLKRILMHYDILDEPMSALWVGDNLTKDILVGERVGVFTVWAKYGFDAFMTIAMSSDEIINFYNRLNPPELHAKRGARHFAKGEDGFENPPEPDATISSFSEILQFL